MAGNDFEHSGHAATVTILDSVDKQNYNFSVQSVGDFTFGISSFEYRNVTLVS